MARDGWSIKDAAAVLGIHPKKVPQSIDPAIEKVARLMLAQPYPTWIELQQAMERIRTNGPNRRE